jgi:integrase
MSGQLQAHVDDYLRLRRAVGFKLKEDERTLGQLVSYLEAAGATTVTSELAISWARLPVGVHPNRWAKRLRIARGFAAYLQTIDPTAEIPPPDVFPTRRQRATPYLFSQQDMCRLLAEARGLRHPMRAASYEALFGLLAVSGMRIGEAVALERADVDLDARLITIRKAKGDRVRLVPLHPTAAEALRGYASERDRMCPTARSRAFFLSSAGTPVLDESLRKTFREITTRLGIRTQTVQPRIHDLRHRFAVQTLIDWYRAGVKIDERIPVLSTYLGHVSPSDTYWYLSASPELMALAADRVADRFGGVR